MQQPVPPTDSPVVASKVADRPTAKVYHTPSFIQLGKVEQLTGQTTTGGTTKGTTKATTGKNGRAS